MTMARFDVFMSHVEDGNLKNLIESFQPDFLKKCVDNEKNRPIHYACQKDNLKIVEFLLQKNCSLECETTQKWRPIHYACQKGHLKIVEFLLQKNCIVECETIQKMRPIHYACENGHVEIVKLLLQKNCNIECANELNRRPIHYACQKGHLNIFEVLLQMNCNLECETTQKMRPIHHACENGHVEIVKFLLEKNCNIECENDLKNRPIHCACQKGHVEIVKLLLQKNGNIESENGSKCRLIHYACLNGHLEVVKFLIQKNCSMECENEYKIRPIHFACQKGHLEIVKLLIENKCSMECETSQKMRPIHYATKGNHLKIVKYLVQSMCRLDCRTEDNQTPLDIAMGPERQLCAEFLDAEIVNRKKIFQCVRENNAQALDKMYNYAILTTEDYETGFSLLEVSLQSNANEIIDYFFHKTVHIEEISSMKNYAKFCTRPDAIQLIQECLLYRSIRFRDADGFHNCCLAKSINECGKLVKSSFLEIAAEFSCNVFIDQLLKKSYYNAEKWTKAKDLAILKGHTDISEAISSRQILITNRLAKSFTCLHSAVCDNDPDMIKYILEKKLDDPNATNEVVGTPLALGHIMSNDKCIEMLEKFNVNVDTQNKFSQSPLLEAIESGMIDHCPNSISRTNKIDESVFMGFTHLQYAVILGHEELCDQLVKKGADCVKYVKNLQQSLIKKTVMPISIFENAVTLCMKIHSRIYPSFFEVLDSDKDKCFDGDGNSLLHMAVKCLQPNLCSTLIKSGFNCEAINFTGNTPLLELFSNVENADINNVIETLNILIESGVDVNKRSKLGLTVFHEASQLNSEKLMISLLSKMPKLTSLTNTDFKLAFTNHWFEYATTLIDLMPEESLQSFINNEIFNLAMLHPDTKLIMSLFEKSTYNIQQSIIEDLLYHLVLLDQYEEFTGLLNIKINQPKFFKDGETLLTSLLKNKNVGYSFAIINNSTNKKYIAVSNLKNETPLQVAIESELFNLIISLIFNCNNQLTPNFNWDTPLISLFQKLSISVNEDVDQELLNVIKIIIGRGGDIYKEIYEGSPIINYCTRLAMKKEITNFQDTEMPPSKKDDKKKSCSVCSDREVNCALPCGHTFCMECGERLNQCAICNSKNTRSIRLYFS